MSKNNKKNPIIRNLQSYFSNVLTSPGNTNPIQSKEDMLVNDFGIITESDSPNKNRRSKSSKPSLYFSSIIESCCCADIQPI